MFFAELTDLWGHQVVVVPRHHWKQACKRKETEADFFVIVALWNIMLHKIIVTYKCANSECSSARKKILFEKMGDSSLWMGVKSK